ncbi:MAG: hypothetical protein ACRERC_13500 [Candidatus Binatia bacterium]|jgi:hypothetical protein
MASNDSYALSARSAGLERRRETIVLVRWALILTCAYLMLLGRATTGPAWLAPLLVAAFLASNLFLGRMPRENFGRQSFKVAVAIMDTLFIAAALFVAQQLSVELLLLCLGVLVMAIAGLSLGVIAGVTIGMTVLSLLVNWTTGGEVVLQTSLLLRVPFLLGAALVFALLVEGGGRRTAAAMPETADDLVDTLAAHVAKQNEAIRRYQSAMAEGGGSPARSAIEDVMLHNRQMAQTLSRYQPEARHAA